MEDSVYGFPLAERPEQRNGIPAYGSQIGLPRDPVGGEGKGEFEDNPRRQCAAVGDKKIMIEDIGADGLGPGVAECMSDHQFGSALDETDTFRIYIMVCLSIKGLPEFDGGLRGPH